MTWTHRMVARSGHDSVSYVLEQDGIECLFVSMDAVDHTSVRVQAIENAMNRVDLDLLMEGTTPHA